MNTKPELWVQFLLRTNNGVMNVIICSVSSSIYLKYVFRNVGGLKRFGPQREGGSTRYKN